jgi:hypothetical protein
MIIAIITTTAIPPPIIRMIVKSLGTPLGGGDVLVSVDVVGCVVVTGKTVIEITFEL